MFIINLIPLHVFVLLLMQRYSRRVYIGKKKKRAHRNKQGWTGSFQCDAVDVDCVGPTMFPCVYCSVDASKVFNSETAAIHSHKTPTHQLTSKAAGVTRSYLFPHYRCGVLSRVLGKETTFVIACFIPVCHHIVQTIQAWTTGPLPCSDLLRHQTVSSPTLNLG